MKMRILVLVATIMVIAGNYTSFAAEVPKEDLCSICEGKQISVEALSDEDVMPVASIPWRYNSVWINSNQYIEGSFPIATDKEGTIGATIKLEGSGMSFVHVKLKKQNGSEYIADQRIYGSGEIKRTLNSSAVKGVYILEYHAGYTDTGMRINCWLY